MSKYVHLNVRTHYSVVDSMLKVEELIDSVKKDGGTSIAITDYMNMFGAVKFFKYAKKNRIKPILGVTLRVKNELNEFFNIVVLCKNNIGYLNVSKIISKAYERRKNNEESYVDKDSFINLNEGLIVICGGPQGEIYNKKSVEESIECISWWKKIFGDDFYLECSIHKKHQNISNIEKMLYLASITNTAGVATNNVRFKLKEHYQSHLVRVAINRGCLLTSKDIATLYSEEQYLKSQSDMVEIFCEYPELIENTVEISKKCNFEFIFDRVLMPIYKSKIDNVDVNQLIKEKSQSQLDNIQVNDLENYQNRLDLELSIIKKMGFSGYFLIVADFIRWAKLNDVPVGPGRGSGAGSLVAFLLGITGIDPIEGGLLFERFLNPDRVSLPDFDIDFCMNGRDKVITYVSNKYGKKSVSQIITFGTMSAKAVIRDVGRALGMSYGFVDKLAKLIPNELGITLSRALETSSDLNNYYKDEEEVTQLINMSLELEGTIRNIGRHAGGVLIAPKELTYYMPTYYEDANTMVLSQFDKDDLEDLGLVKFDFLGLKTLTTINKAITLIKENNNIDIDINKIDKTDKKVYKLLQDGDTKAIFQLESSGMSELIKRLLPDRFEDLIALVALYRPGPLQSGMVDDFINRKHGRSQTQYLDISLQKTLEPTYGVILYQEQVMEIARILSGFSLASADLLRRAMGKKKPKEMLLQKNKFVEGAKKNGVENSKATQIFELIEKFSGYGFNKSHSAAYALISYQTAWLKVNYMAEYMASALSVEMDNTEKLVELMNDCKKLGIGILYPDINKSFYEFSVASNNSILFGLGSVKGLGKSVIENIINERVKLVSFKSCEEFLSCLNMKKFNKKSLEGLIKCGALDVLDYDRATLLNNIEQCMSYASDEFKNKSIGQMDLFSSINQGGEFNKFKLPDKSSYDSDKILQYEKSVLGFYISGHPINAYENDFNKLAVKIPSSIEPAKDDKSFLIAGWITGIRKIISKRRKIIVFLNIEDSIKTIDLTLFEELYLEYNIFIKKDSMILGRCTVSHDKDNRVRYTLTDIYDLESFYDDRARYVEIYLKNNDEAKQKIQNLHSCIYGHLGGKNSIVIKYDNGKLISKMKLDKKYAITITHRVLIDLRNIFGVENVNIFC